MEFLANCLNTSGTAQQFTRVDYRLKEKFALSVCARSTVAFIKSILFLFVNSGSNANDTGRDVPVKKHS